MMVNAWVMVVRNARLKRQSMWTMPLWCMVSNERPETCYLGMLLEADPR